MSTTADPRDSLAHFLAAAKAKGTAAFGAQRDCALAVLRPLEAVEGALLPEAGEVVRALLGELRRLHTNFSCRSRQRSQEVRSARAELTALLRRARSVEARLDPRGAESSSRKRRRELRARADRAERRTGRPHLDSDISSNEYDDDDDEMCAELVATGSCDHLCPHLCYFREHEGPRQLFALRLRVAAAAGSARALDSWRTVVERGRRNNWRVIFVDPAGGRYETAAAVLKTFGLSHNSSSIREESTDALRAALWPEEDERSIHASGARASPYFCKGGGPGGGPARSPFGLLEEILWHDEYKLLAACLMLNVTTRAQVDVVLWRLFFYFPDARAAAGALDDPSRLDLLESILRPLGLHRKRARRLSLMARDWLRVSKGGRPLEAVANLHGVGSYATDAYELFARGRVPAQGKPPRDHALRWYHAWVLERFIIMR